MTRRTVVATLGAAAVVPPAVLLAGPPSITELAPPQALGLPASSRVPYLFFDPLEARFVEPACERLMPTDDAGPAAPGVAVALYLDRQLAGAWGTGLRPYRTGPWQAGTWAPSSGSGVPAALFRTALGAINREFAARGSSFSDLDPPAQRCFLGDLAAGRTLLDGVAPDTFFELLLAMTVEGFFSVSGSGRAARCGLIAWPLKSFPGAYFRPSGLGARNPAATSQSQR